MFSENQNEKYLTEKCYGSVLNILLFLFFKRHQNTGNSLCSSLKILFIFEVLWLLSMTTKMLAYVDEIITVQVVVRPFTEITTVIFLP